MSATGAHNRRRRGAPPAEHADERWLLTYADMITLLMALFIVLWAISSVNVSKFDQLKASLHSAFSGKVLPTSGSVLTGGQAAFAQDGTPVTPPVQNPQPAFTMDSIKSTLQSEAKQQDVQNLRAIQQKVEQYAHQHGLAGMLKTSIDERGLVIRILTDATLFDSGQAVLKQPSALLSELSSLIGRGLVNPVRVEGNTDDVPVSTAQFHSNWDLASARANAVLEFLLAHGVAASRLSSVGYADQRPIASNATAAGRSLNRRVNLVILRRTFK